MAKSKRKQMYIVACTELHAASGPFADAKDALRVAKVLNEEQDKCIFVPVPFEFAPNVQVQGSFERKTDTGGYGGQYL